MRDKLNTKNINELVGFSKRLVRVLYVIAIILGVYAAILVFNALNIGPFLLSLLKILLPLFIGLLLAWLFKPLVNKLQNKGMRKGLACTLVYIIFIGIIVWILFTLIPLLYNQTSELISQLPTIGADAQVWINNIFSKLESIPGLDVDDVKLSLLSKLQDFGTSLTSKLPEYTVSVISSLVSGVGTFFLGLVIGFYILLTIENPLGAMKDFLPKKARKTFEGIVVSINDAARSFISGAVIDSTLVFIVSSLLLWIVGLKAPLLFGLFCGITNVIPYAGPYIGGAPAVIVGFSQSPITGLLTLAMLVIIQSIEGSFIQPLIMSKSTKLHPVTIMMGLLIFGHFWGILGMFISTPAIAAVKAVVVYLDEKYDILNFK
ncbi:MAG: AI-2E family transporter [Bacilli bacterium]|nr:AI-2E family transporter [Bacilli bacterium]